MSDLESIMDRFRQIAADFNEIAKLVEVDLIDMDEVSEACLAGAQSYCEVFVREARAVSTSAGG
jgi:hypothetical protein